MPTDLFAKPKNMYVQQARQLGVYPYFHELESRQDTEVIMEGKRRIMLGSNNYLGLTVHPRVIAAGVQALQTFGSGCSGSRFLNGTLSLHTQLERELAGFLHKEAVMTFSTGFQSNLGIISAICGKDDYILSDKENHASIYDGCKLSYAKMLRYRHNDMEELERRLQQVPDTAGCLIVTDGVFSMGGDICNLPEIVRLARKYGARVMVDDAHGLGVIGEGGRGTASYYGLEDEVDIIMGTFSKSLASIGGFMAASEEEISQAFRPNTKLLFGETISNPGVMVLDIEKFARIAHSHGVPLIVDNTFATPINCRPFEWGADIVTHSTTKYMDGHATSVGGCIVDSGNFDWEAHADKFPGLCQPDPSYHGLTYTKAFGKMAYITKATSQLMRDLGSIQSPQNAFLLNLGLETLHLRMPQHCQNALKVARGLSQCDKVAWVHYPDLEENPYHALQQKYLPKGSCGVLSFGLKGGRDVAIKFMDSLKLAAIVTHVADARTCVLHPASHTHRQLTDEQLREAGVAPDLIRFSVGIENAEDIIADIEQALKA